MIATELVYLTAEWRKPALALGDWGPTASNNCQPKNTNGTLLGPIGVCEIRTERIQTIKSIIDPYDCSIFTYGLSDADREIAPDVFVLLLNLPTYIMPAKHKRWFALAALTNLWVLGHHPIHPRGVPQTHHLRQNLPANLTVFLYHTGKTMSSATEPSLQYLLHLYGSLDAEWVVTSGFYENRLAIRTNK